MANNLPAILKHYQGLGVSLQSDVEIADMDLSRLKGEDKICSI